jgi:hypothetical protein
MKPEEAFELNPSSTDETWEERADSPAERKATIV